MLAQFIELFSLGQYAGSAVMHHKEPSIKDVRTQEESGCSSDAHGQGGRGQFSRFCADILYGRLLIRNTFGSITVVNCCTFFNLCAIKKDGESYCHHSIQNLIK